MINIDTNTLITLVEDCKTAMVEVEGGDKDDVILEQIRNGLETNINFITTAASLNNIDRHGISLNIILAGFFLSEDIDASLKALYVHLTKYLRDIEHKSSDND